MEAVTKYNYVRSSAQKLRLLANLIRKKNISEALKILMFTKKKSSFILKKVLNTALANAKHNFNITDFNKYKIKKIFIDVGPSMKRIMPRAKGKTDYILKRTSHITMMISN